MAEITDRVDEPLFDIGKIEAARAKRLFSDIDESDSVEIPVQLLEELRQARVDEEAHGDGRGQSAYIADNILLWVDTH